MKIDPLIKTIISMTNIDHFTVVEVRTAYLALSKNEKLDPARVRKLVYAQLHRLVAKGWLSISTSELRRITTFSKTKIFTSFGIGTSTSESELESKARTAFKQELDVCNAELLECLGALETYINLWDKHPHLKIVFEERYFEVQEKYHILKGKIRTLNTLLKIPN